MKRKYVIGMDAWVLLLTTAAVLLGVMPAKADYTNAVLASGPILYYRCNEASGTVATNASGTGAPNGTYGGGPTFAKAGAPINISGGNTSVGFNGSSQYLKSDLTGLGLIGDNYTLEFLFRHLSPDGHVVEYVAGRSGGSSTQELICIGGSNFGPANKLCLVVGGTAYLTTYEPYNYPVAGTWYHCALTRTGTTATLYINGVSVLSTNVANTGISPILDWARRGDNTWFYQGDLDEIAVYPRALSQSEIRTHVAQATLLPASAYYDTQIQSDHPLVYYRCEETNGTTAVNDATHDPLNPWYFAYPATYSAISLQQAGPTLVSRATNNAVAFDGLQSSGSYMRTPDLSGQLGDAYSAEFWMKNTMAENNRAITCYFLSRGAGALGDVIGINGTWYADHKNEMLLVVNNVPYFTNWNPPENQWMHIAFTRDGAGNVALYTNGASLFTTNAAVSGLPGTIDFGHRSDNTWSLQGYMDEIAVFTNALTPAQVLAHYRAASSSGITHGTMIRIH